MIRKLFLVALVVAAGAAAIGFGGRSAQAQIGVHASSGGPYAGVPGVAIQFNGTASFGYALRYYWQFGDGTVSTAPAPVKAYGLPGVYSITLTVTDAFGVSSTAVTTATIGAGPLTGFSVAGGGVVASGLNAYPSAANSSSCLYGANGYLFCASGAVFAPGSVAPVYPTIYNYQTLANAFNCYSIYGNVCAGRTVPLSCYTVYLNSATGALHCR